MLYPVSTFGRVVSPLGQPTCSESTETMLRVCERLGIPVALDKLEGPATTITFFGITIDTTLQQLRLPPDKLQEMTLLIKSWLGKHKTTKRDLLSLIGKLSFAAKVVPSGRLFLRQLIELSTTVSKLHHHIHLNVEAREISYGGTGSCPPCTINLMCCPHHAMQRYLGQVTWSARKPFFLFESGTALTARALRLVLYHLIHSCGYSTKLYHTHSLRIGAATAVSRSGLPPATIKNLGRWRSEAYKVYTCHPLTQP